MSEVENSIQSNANSKKQLEQNKAKKGAIIGSLIGFFLGIVIYALLFAGYLQACFSLGGDYGPPYCDFFWNHLDDTTGIYPLLAILCSTIIGGTIGGAWGYSSKTSVNRSAARIF